MRFAVIVPVYGQPALTTAMLGDIGDRADVVIVDNGGDHEATHGETVLRPGTNLGWLGGTNYGTTMFDADAYVWMNNDVRLSTGFFGGLAAVLPDVGVVAPLYDDVWPHQRSTYNGKAVNFEPYELERTVPFVDGTCMALSRKTIETVGLLDSEHFGRFGWGADLDYCIRIRDAGGDVVVTHRSYLNHIGRGTARHVRGYFTQANAEMTAGMVAKWGANWRTLVEW